MMTNPILPLPANLRDELVDHFLCLSKEDLRLRFGHALALPSIVAYADDIDFDIDGVFGVLDDSCASWAWHMSPRCAAVPSSE